MGNAMQRGVQKPRMQQACRQAASVRVDQGRGAVGPPSQVAHQPQGRAMEQGAGLIEVFDGTCAQQRLEVLDVFGRLPGAEQDIRRGGGRRGAVAQGPEVDLGGRGTGARDFGAAFDDAAGEGHPIARLGAGDAHHRLAGEQGRGGGGHHLQFIGERQGGDRVGRAMVLDPGRPRLAVQTPGDAACGAVLRPGFDQAHAQARGLIDLQAVDRQHGAADDERPLGVAPALMDLELDRDAAAVRRDLAAIVPQRPLAERQGLEAGGGHALVHPLQQHQRLHGLQHGFDAQRPWLDRVLEEVRLEEPDAGDDVLFRPDQAQALGPALGPETADAVDHQQLGIGQAGGAAEQGRGPAGQVDGLGRRARDVHHLAAEALLIGHGLGREEAEHRLHVQQGLAIDRAADPELLDDQVAHAVQRHHLDHGGDGAVAGADFAVLHRVSVQVAEQQLGLAGLAAQGVRRQPAAGLQGDFHQDAVGHGRRAVVVEVPGVLGHVVERSDPSAGLHRRHRALERSDAGEEMVGRAGQARRAHRPVIAGEPGAEGVRRPAPGAADQRAVVQREVADMGQRSWIGKIGGGQDFR